MSHFQIPLNDDTGSEVVRKVVRNFNDMIDAVAGAADFATAQGLLADFKVELDLLPERPQTFGESR